jgi:predicted transcriptional regulator
MSDEQQERIEELEELLEESQESLICRQDEVEQLTSELSDSLSQEDYYEQKESIMNKSFNAGFDANLRGEPRLKSWLNHKIEARI